jgi:predicted dinucleotide-binding enzyme
MSQKLAVFVIGGTGNQGGAVVKACSSGHEVARRHA